MPLVYLGLDHTRVARLPETLQQVSTLRLIELVETPLGCPCVMDDPGEAEWLAHLERMRESLLPLGAAVPGIVFKMGFGRANHDLMDKSVARRRPTRGFSNGYWSPSTLPNLLDALQERKHMR